MFTCWSITWPTWARASRRSCFNPRYASVSREPPDWATWTKQPQRACASSLPFTTFGKANVGFQAQIWRNEDLQGRLKPRWAGHTSDIVPVLTGTDNTTASWFLDAIGWHEHIENWDSDGGDTASAMFVAAMSHHGEPLNLYDAKSANPEAWREFGELSPRACVECIGTLAQSWFPQAFVANAPPLPSAPAFQHMFLGLSMHTRRLDRLKRRTLPIRGRAG